MTASYFVVVCSNLRAGAYALQRHHSEALQAFVELPLCLPRPVVVQHVGIGHHRRRLQAVNHQTEVAAAHAHAGPFKLLQCGDLS